jgi:DNA-binding PadR family transcriptional regulator
VRKADRDLTALTVLALLLTGARHAYEMLVLIEKTHKTFVTGLPRSLYHAADRLVARGDIEVVGTTREGGRPERTVYALTPAGRVRLAEWVALLLRTPDPDSSLFTAALTYAGCLPAPTVAALLRARQAEVDGRVRAVGAALEGIGTGLPRILLLEAEYEVSRLTAERDWVARLTGDIDAGRLTWLAAPDGVAGVEALLHEHRQNQEGSP